MVITAILAIHENYIIVTMVSGEVIWCVFVNKVLWGHNCLYVVYAVLVPIMAKLNSDNTVEPVIT